MDAGHRDVGHGDAAGGAAGAALVGVLDDVVLTPNGAVRLLHAAPNAHPSKARRRQQHHLVLGTCGVEGLPLAVLRRVTCGG